MDGEVDIIIFETCGGRNFTITRRARHVFKYTNHKQRLLGYQDKIKGKVYPIVNSITKACIQGRYLPVLLVMNNSTLLDDPYET